ncbi:MAG: AAA family ATPase [Thaumarchaeota archaeon]|nr:AAA family ATPase [Nitrososphaerota archaeon]
MTEIISVAGGKGGTGKTLVAVNLAYMLNQDRRTLLVDVDVDNPCTRSFFEVRQLWEKKVLEFRPKINQDLCKLCGICVRNCPEHALVMIPGKQVMLVEELCAGCGVCRLVCPFNAIEESWIEGGVVKGYETEDGIDLVVGELQPTCRRSPVMILKTLNVVKDLIEKYEYIVMDAPPGADAGIYSIMDYSETILAVTEPTPLGLMDLKKIYRLYQKFFHGRKRFMVIINKYGLPGGSDQETRRFLEENGIAWTTIPYDDLIVRSYIAGELIVKAHPDSKAASSLRGVIKLLGKEI